MKKENQGITLIALVVTIIVLLILAGVTVTTLTGDNGLLTKAGETKNATEIAEEKDIISISAIQAQAENRQGNLEKNNFNEALVANSKTGNKASIIAEDIGSFTVKFESNRYYEVNKDGNISHIENATGEKTLKVQCVNSKNEVLGEYEYTIVTNNYSKLPPAIDKYESSEERIEGEITENKTIQVLYYLICNDDTTLVFTGLDSNGNITTNENEIVSYMLGDGSNTDGNGLKEKSIKSLLKIPPVYKGEIVTTIGRYSFHSCNNIVGELYIPDNIKNINYASFVSASGIESLVLEKNIEKIEARAFENTRFKTVIFKTRTCNLESDLFRSNSNFTEIKIEGNEDLYKIEDNILYSKDGEKLLLCPIGRKGELIIPNTVKTIGYCALHSCSGITSVIFSDSVISTEYGAFSAEMSLQEVIIGKNVTLLGSNCFNSDTSLKTVTINSPTIAKSITKQTASGKLVYYAETIYIKSDITEIGSYIIDNYNIVETDKEGYVKYIKK